MIGEKFNSLTVLDVSEERKYNCVNYLCRCGCGVETLATKAQLVKGKKENVWMRKIR